VDLVVAKDPARAFDRKLYYATRFVAQMAQNLLLAALFVAAGTSASAGVDLSSLFVATLAPAILLGFAGGAVVDRVGAPRGFALGALLRTLPVAVAFLFMANSLSAWVVACAYSAGSQVYSPAEMALVHTLRRDAPGQAHSLLVGLQYAGQGAGMIALAPALYFLGGPHAMLGGALAGFAVVLALAIALSTRLHAEHVSNALSRRGIPLYTLAETFRFFRREARALHAVVLLALTAIFMRAVVITLPMYLTRDMGLEREAIGFLVAPGIAGFLAGLAWAGRLRNRDDALATARRAVIGATVAVFALAALDYGLTAVAEYSHVPPIVYLEATMNTTFVVALPVAFLIGASISAALVSARVVLTETAPEGQQARVFAVQITLTDALLVLPLLAMGVGTQYAGARPTLGAIGILATVALLALEWPRIRGAVPAHTSEEEPAPLPVIA
jgi:MFS family permease